MKKVFRLLITLLNFWTIFFWGIVIIFLLIKDLISIGVKEWVSIQATKESDYIKSIQERVHNIIPTEIGLAISTLIWITVINFAFL